MPRTPSPRRPVRAVLALTVGAASLVGLAQASAAPPVTYALTGASPATVEADVSDGFGVTLTGKGLTRRTRVTFGTCAGGPVVPSVLSPTKLVVRPPSCAAGPQDLTVTEDGATSPRSTLTGKFTFLAKPVVEALEGATAAVQPAAGPWSGGTAATVTVKDPVPAKAPVQVLLTTAGVTKPVPGKVDATNTRKIAFKVPAGAPGGKPEIAVSTFGITSEAVADLFTYRSTIKTTPNVWVRDTAAPTVKVDGAGFGRGTPVVTICGVEAPLVAGKAPTDKSLLVTPPAWSAVTSAGVHAEAGGVCTVRVAVPGGETSVVTAGSTFTYAAH